MGEPKLDPKRTWRSYRKTHAPKEKVNVESVAKSTRLKFRYIYHYIL